MTESDSDYFNQRLFDGSADISIALSGYYDNGGEVDVATRLQMLRSGTEYVRDTLRLAPHHGIALNSNLVLLAKQRMVVLKMLVSEKVLRQARIDPDL